MNITVIRRYIPLTTTKFVETIMDGVRDRDLMTPLDESEAPIIDS